jgi:hypothetical protein
MILQVLRDIRPSSPDHLWTWVSNFTGVRIARAKVCRDHRPPFDFFADWQLTEASQTIVLGPRGGGKSFLSALDCHLKSRFHPRYKSRILGGSLAQSRQIYEALREGVLFGSGRLGSDAGSIAKLLKREATYRNGSEVAILAASTTSVRGPHVPGLRLDEVDEIDDEIREAAFGMAMADRTRGYPTAISLTSTWHRVDGPMGRQIEQARACGTPFYAFCAFEVLERCPESRSGPYVGGRDAYAHCPACPLVRWCHAERDRNGDVPLAKRSAGHYAIDALIQKVRGVSLRTFEADYLCLGPRAEGLWFPGFAESTHVRDAAEFDPALPVHLALDSGVTTGAVFFQVAPVPAAAGAGPTEEIHIFADFLAEGQPAEHVARALLDRARSRCLGRLDVIATDPAGGARNPVGPTVIAEYERVGLRPLRYWPIGPVADGLALVESFLQPAEGPPRLIIHPRCQSLITALQNYRRAKRGGQWQDYPLDPQHPFEDMIDALRGGLKVAFPEGRRPGPQYRRVRPSRLRF